MDEEALIQQVREHMTKQGITQAELGKRVAPDSKKPRQSIHQYFAGTRGFLTGKWKIILDELGLELVVREKGK